MNFFMLLFCRVGINFKPLLNTDDFVLKTLIMFLTDQRNDQNNFFVYNRIKLDKKMQVLRYILVLHD